MQQARAGFEELSMRAPVATRWAIYALAMSLAMPAFAQPKVDPKADAKADAKATARTIAECTTFDQADKGDSAVTFTIHSGCTVPIDCSVSWRVVCAPDTKKRRSVHAGTAKMSLQLATGSDTEASASACGDDSWAIDNVEWSCQPNKD
jgi:hypothetical protein